MLQRADEGPREETYLTDILGACGRVDGDVVVPVSCRGHMVETMSVIDAKSPAFTCFVPTSVGCVGSEDCTFLCDDNCLQFQMSFQ